MLGGVLRHCSSGHVVKDCFIAAILLGEPPTIFRDKAFYVLSIIEVEPLGMLRDVSEYHRNLIIPTILTVTHVARISPM